MPFDNNNFANMANYYPVNFEMAPQCGCDHCRRASRTLWAPPGGWEAQPPLSPALRRIITEARALVAKGWVQGSDKAPNSAYRDDDDPLWVYCARGAVREAIGTHDSYLERAVVAHLASFTPRIGDVQDGHPDNMLVRFNDWATTTQADVVAVFDRALA